MPRPFFLGPSALLAPLALLGAAACAKTPAPAPAASESPLATAAPSGAPTAAQVPARPGGDAGDGDIADADQVIGRLRPVFRKCYADGLREDATMAGRVVFSAEVEPKGNVGHIAVQTRTGRLSDPVVACMSLAIQKARFAPPTSGHVAALAIPISFVMSAADASTSEEETGVKNAVTTSCAAALRKRGAANEANLSRQCECSWTILRRTFSAAEINDAKLVEDPRFASVKEETARVCVPGAK